MAANSPKKVLIIDDEPEIVEMIKSLLDMRGYQPLATTQWTEAVDVAEHEKPDLMLLDLNMPTIDGVSLLRFLREQDYTFPVVVVSGYIDEEIRDSLKPFGVVAFVDKPFEIHHLSTIVSSAIDEQAVKDVSAESEISPVDAVHSESSDLDVSQSDIPVLENSGSDKSSVESADLDVSDSEPADPPAEEPVLPQTADLHNPGVLSPRRTHRRNRERVMVPPPRKSSFLGSIFRSGMVQYFLIAVVCMLLAGFLIVIVEQNQEKPIQLYLPR